MYQILLLRSLFVKHLILPVLAVVLFCGAAVIPAHAAGEQELRIAQNRLVKNAEGLQLQFGCSVAGEDLLRDLLKDGASIELAISAEIEGHRSWWSNSTIASKLFSSVLGHDQLTREFTLTLPNLPEGQLLREKNLTRLLHKSWRQFTLPLLTPEELATLDDSREYSLRLDIELHHVEVPPWLEKSTLFWSPEVAPAVFLETSFTLPALPAQ